MYHAIYFGDDVFVSFMGYATLDKSTSGAWRRMLAPVPDHGVVIPPRAALVKPPPAPWRRGRPQ